jgi:hypothetical protein
MTKKLVTTFAVFVILIAGAIGGMKIRHLAGRQASEGGTRKRKKCDSKMILLAYDIAGLEGCPRAKARSIATSRMAATKWRFKRSTLPKPNAESTAS